MSAPAGSAHSVASTLEPTPHRWWSNAGWRRIGTKGDFRYVDADGRPITDPGRLERIRKMAIPPAWTEVWISPDPSAKLQATGIDAAGRRQYRYSDDFRRHQDQLKFDRLTRFAGMLPILRMVMTKHMDAETLGRDRVTAIALRLIDEGWFRVGNERYAQRDGTYGITTLLKQHVRVHRPALQLAFVGKHHKWIERSLVDEELALAVEGLKTVPGGPRLFRYREGGELSNLTSQRLNAYVHRHGGEEFTAKDFRTWGGTLAAAIGFAERGPAASPGAQKRVIAAVMHEVADRLGNTPAVARASYVSPAVVDEYVEGRTIADYRPRGLRVVGGRETLLNPEEAALAGLCEGWHQRHQRVQAA
ncbi:MAG TPA: hypothetical protein VFN41_14500 [Candidatus Limnocylindrales bacterium]|nr:hypothetical protein [Candidatus Limnocylindrales bacterium]